MIPPAERYRRIGRTTAGFANGKMRGDPVYQAVSLLVGETGSVADVGCGEGYLLAWLRHHRPALQLFGLDHDSRRLDLARRALADEPHLELRSGDMRSAPVPASDYVICLDVLHYLPVAEQDQVIHRLAKCVRPGGSLIIRDGEAGAGMRSTLLGLSERLAVAIGRHKGDGVFFRPAGEIPEQMRHAGLEVRVHPCHEGTPFANLLFVGCKP